MIERTHRLAPPSSEEVREARLRAGLTQAQALGLVSYDPSTSYRTWQSYEVPEGRKEHRAIPSATWELFLLLTGQHPFLTVSHVQKATQSPTSSRRPEPTRSYEA